MLMPNRHGDGGESPMYGFQGQENDDEIRGKGNSVNYKYRMADVRIGRFFATDPLEKTYVWNSPYAFSENSTIAYVELEGLEKAENAYTQWARGAISGYAKDRAEFKKSGLSSTDYSKVKKAQEANAAMKQGGMATYGNAYILNAYSNGRQYVTPGDVDEVNAKSAEVIMLLVPWGRAFKLLKFIPYASKGAKAYQWTANTLGKIGEKTVQGLYGGAKKTFTTLTGKTRFVDIFSKGVAYESKVGYKSATEFIKKQFAKDLELLAEGGEVKEVIWTFMKSPKTGQVGASKPLLKMFEDAQKAGFNIKSEIVDVSKKAIKEVQKAQ
jgi:RHS repeat-associated protein